MSIFDDKKDFSKIKNNKLKNLIDSLEISFWGDWNYKYVANEYAVKILSEMDAYDSSWWPPNNLEYIEFIWNVILYFEINNRSSHLDPIVVQGWKNIILKIVDAEGLHFKEIENYKHKLIPKDINQLTNQIEHKIWRKEINKFFTFNKDDEWIEKLKILSWFANHIDGDVRKGIEKLKIFDKTELRNLMKDLHNIYKHFNANKKGSNLEDFKKFQKLPQSEKNKKAENDMWLITYLLIEYERKEKQNNENK